MGLIIFCSSENPQLGEKWHVPASFYTLGAFVVMLFGAWAYVVLFWMTSKQFILKMSGIAMPA